MLNSGATAEQGSGWCRLEFRSGARRFGTLLAAVCLSVAVEAQPVQWPAAVGGNDNWFQVVVTPGNVNWVSANAAAATMTFAGVNGRLATASNMAKDNFLKALAAGTPGAFVPIPAPGSGQSGPWIGAVQPAGSTEPAGGWGWINPAPWGYPGWFAGEPNQGAMTGSDENVIHYFANVGPLNPTTIGWNDLNSVSAVYPVQAYIVEFVTCAGDVNGDDAVDLTDLLLVLGSFGGGAGGDADGDGDTDLDDQLLVLGNYGKICDAD